MMVEGAGFLQVVVMETAAAAAQLYNKPPLSPPPPLSSLPFRSGVHSMLESLPEYKWLRTEPRHGGQHPVGRLQNVCELLAVAVWSRLVVHKEQECDVYLVTFTSFTPQHRCQRIGAQCFIDDLYDCYTPRNPKL